MSMDKVETERVADSITAHREPRRYAIPIAITSVVAAGVLLHFIGSGFLAFVAALFLANIFMPLVSGLRKRNVPVFVSILLVLVLVSGLFFGIAKIIGLTISSIVAVLPKYEAKWETVFLPQIATVLGSVSDGLRQQAMDFKLSSVVGSNMLAPALASATSFLGGFGIIILLMLFILAANGQFKKKIEYAFPLSGSFQLVKIIENIEKHVRRYLITTLIINTAAAVTMTVVLLLFGVDLALLWGILTFLLMFIQGFGSIVAIGPPVLAAFLQFDTAGTPILITITVIVTQLLINSVISPRVLGSTLNISPLLILVS